MRKIGLLILPLLLLCTCLSAQKNETITVKAGTRAINYFPYEGRYRYPKFVPGKVFFKNGSNSEAFLNYNNMVGEMEFIKSLDTLAIVNKKNVTLIIAAQDTFYYDNGYLEQISDGSVKVFMKHYVKLKDIVKKNPFGGAVRGSSVDSYSSVSVSGRFHELLPNEEWVFQRTFEYYLRTLNGEFVQFTKKNTLNIFTLKEDEIKRYLKSNKVRFSSKDDLLRFADYLGNF
jgi:hypothetical protein